MSEQRIRNAAVRLWVSPETDERVRRIADAEGKSVSSVYRDLIHKGLVAGGYQPGEKDMAALVKSAVEETMKSHTDRLAAISAKATQISAAAFFMSVYTGKLVLPEDIRADFDEAAALARKLGVEYLKLPRDKSLDEFIGRAMTRMEEDMD